METSSSSSSSATKLVVLGAGAPKRSICAGAGAATLFAGTSLKIRLAKVRNSSSPKIPRSFSSSYCSSLKSTSSKSTGTSILIVASSLDKSPCCAKFSTFSFCFPLSWSTFSSIPSSVPYSFRSLTAVFSPIPGIPGILSTASPMSPRISRTRSTWVMSHFSQICLGPITSTALPMKAGL